jgi:putative addiction module component (TIGR02574 family)
METQIPSSVPMSQLLALSVPEKLALIGALSDSIEPMPAPAWQLDELHRREESESTSPEATVTWNEALQRVRAAHAQPRSA